LQVRDVLADRIARSDWKPGFTVPNEGDLAHDLGVSTGTVRKALNLLEADRLVTRRQGKGTFVNDPTSDELAYRFMRLRAAGGESLPDVASTLSVSEGVASALERTRLQLRADDGVYRIRRARHRAGRNFVVADITLPAALFPGLAGRTDIPDRVGALAAGNGLLFGRGEERVSIRVPPADIAGLLGITPGTCVMLLDCIIFLLGTRRPVVWRVAHVHLPDGHYLSEWT
jgi:GntR family transcriptional regulator